METRSFENMTIYLGSAILEVEVILDYHIISASINVVSLQNLIHFHVAVDF